jgi:poly-gamma-glutamate synthesis protein (capsule biosynthesis protein)
MALRLDEYFEDVSVSFINLESSLETFHLEPRPLNGIGQIVSAPESCLDYLAAIHSQAVGIANNHSYDFGHDGLLRTREIISRRGMIPLGAGHTLADPPDVFVWQGPGDIRVGLWAAAKAAGELATSKRPGVEPALAAQARRAAQALKRQGATICIALIHAGCLRTNRPDPEDVRCLDSIAKTGFQVVASSHSHRIGGYRQIASASGQPCFSFYGLGTLVSGYISAPAEREGLVVTLGLHSSGSLARLEVRPVVLDKTGFGMIPTTDEGGKILSRFQHLSDELSDGSYEQRFYRDMSQGLLRLYARDIRSAYQHAGIKGLVRKMRRVRIRHVRRLVHKVMA